MADVSRRLVRGILTTSNTTLYTVPSNTTTFIKSLSLCNTTTVAVTFDLYFAGYQFAQGHTIKAKDTLIIPCVDQIIHAGESITGNASNQSVIVLISGKEVTP
ncbi:hypothetical protein [Paenibacillus taichungensis]|uniref:hypothetical protein n=1 Tax=Paenibacillus taichungensis TaxID=484184 RepID=UPI00399F6CE1